MYESNWRTRGPLRPSQSPLQEPSIIQNTVGSSIFQVLRPWSLGLQFISFFFFSSTSDLQTRATKKKKNLESWPGLCFQNFENHFKFSKTLE